MSNETKTRNPDITSKQRMSYLVRTHKSGGTIDDLLDSIEKDHGFRPSVESFAASKSQLLAEVRGQFLARKTDAERRLAEAGAGTDDTSNAIRQELRDLAKQETALLPVFKLARRGRSGAGIESQDLIGSLTDAIHEVYGLPVNE